jgi:hypothetical protein
MDMKKSLHTDYDAADIDKVYGQIVLTLTERQSKDPQP